MRTCMLSILFGITLCLYAHHSASTYLISEDYSINFSTKKAEGSFTGLTGEVVFNEDDIGSATMNVSVDVGTIQTGNKTQDKHAKNSKWFDVEKYPAINFVSESVSTSNDQYQVTGTLTIKDVSRRQVIDFHVENNGETNYLIGRTTVNRKDFNIKGNAIGFLVGDEVSVELKVPANFTSHD